MHETRNCYNQGIVTPWIICVFILYLASDSPQTLFQSLTLPIRQPYMLLLPWELPQGPPGNRLLAGVCNSPVHKLWDLPCCMEQRGPTHRPSTHLILQTRFSSKGPTTPMNMTSCRSTQREEHELGGFLECGMDSIKFGLCLISSCLQWWATCCF